MTEVLDPPSEKPRTPLATEQEAREVVAAACEQLGVLDKTHQPLFDALHRDHKPLRTLEDLAGFYAGYGVTPESFLSTAKSFVVEGNLAQGRERAMAFEIQSTPTLIVNGKYRLDAASAGGQAEAIALAQWLVNKK